MVGRNRSGEGRICELGAVAATSLPDIVSVLAGLAGAAFGRRRVP
jgi:hypothetical protein